MAGYLVKHGNNLYLVTRGGSNYCLATSQEVNLREAIASYIDSISDSSISASFSGDIVTFSFPAATPEIANAIVNGLGDGKLVTLGVVRNTGHSNNIILGYSRNSNQDRARKQARG